MADDTAIRAAAHHYMQRGWAIIALYGVHQASDGVWRCDCGRTDCASGGKHPLGAGRLGDGWAPPIKDSGDEVQLPSGANIGLKTGHASGVFALDVDPKNGGDIRLAELEAQYGALPPTWRQQTGSLGRHYVFDLPDDFTPTNSRGRLPVGLDIRGEGGQIVLAPSVSTVGPYRELTLNGRTLPAPDWLLELIRPLPPIEIPASMVSAYMPDAPSDRGAAYALAAVRQEMARLNLAVPGSRNHTAFEVACRLIELSNAPWSGLSEEHAVGAYAQAGLALVDASFTEREMWACWSSAARRVRDKAAVLPPPPGGYPLAAGWGDLGGAGTAPPFSSNGSPSVSAALGPAAAGTWDPFTTALPDRAIYPPTSPDGSAPPASSALGLRALLIPRSQISRIPRPRPLIQGTLWRDTDTWLIGASGSGKSFVVLDWAAHVAAGKTWNNRAVTAGRVLYLVAEGAPGIQQRLDAWEMAQRNAARRASEASGQTIEPVLIPDEFVVLPVPVQAVVRAGREIRLSPGWLELMAIGAEMRPALVVLDTQARVSLGLNENDNGEMGQFVEAVAALRRASGGACMVVVHHTGRNGGDARGASSIDGAQDVEWKVVRPEKAMAGELVLEKNKNGADGVRHPFTLVLHHLGFDQDAMEEVTSLSVDWDTAAADSSGEPEHRTLAAQVQSQILEVLREGSLTTGATKAEIIRLVNKLRISRGLPAAGERTVAYALDASKDGRTPGLLQKELIVQIGQRFADRERYDQAQ